MALQFSSIKQWLKHSQHPVANFLYLTILKLRSIDFPAPRCIYGCLDSLYIFLHNLLSGVLRIILWTPMFKSRLSSYGKNLFLYGGLPFIAGPLNIIIGNRCRISGKTTITGRTVSRSTPELILGNNIDIGWMTTIAVGNRIVLEDNVRVAGQCLLAGYPGHPINAKDRAKGLPETDEQVGDIVLKKDVWLATGVSVMAGVTIGQGSIIAAGSVVTKNIPAKVLAGGCPARIIRQLSTEKTNKDINHET